MEMRKMSDCDNCIHTHYIDNEWYCIIGNRPNKECKDYRHWNGLSDEERETNAEAEMQLLWECHNHK